MTGPEDYQIVVVGNHDRLDAFLANYLLKLSRSRIQGLIREGAILVDSIVVKPREKLKAGSVVSVHIPEKVPARATPEKISLSILYEDTEIAVIDKPHGMVVHPAPGNPNGTLVNALLHHCKGQLSGIGGVVRPGIVHRLDKDTSGCIVIAKSDRAHQDLVRQFAERKSMEKLYLSVTNGIPKFERENVFTHIGRHPVNRQKMAVVNPPGGKTAITDIETIQRQTPTQTALVLCQLHTGRTHQIRVHLHHLGLPILGDPIYGKKHHLPTRRLMLHAWKLSFLHPITGGKVTFHAAPPSEFDPWLKDSTLPRSAD